MSAAVLTTTTTSAFSDAERGRMFTIVLEKMREACFVDWVVGTALLCYYAVALYNGVPLAQINLWPLIAALGITRLGNTITNAVRDWAYWRFHRPGEGVPNGES